MAYSNHMEKVVREEVDAVVDIAGGACLCDRCREDIIARTLNRLPPKYVVTRMGEVYTRIEELKVQRQTDLTVQILEAARVVREHPHHDS